jgi:hypothetical protein
MAQQDDKTSSRLIAKLRDTSRGASAPLGFGRPATRKMAAFILVARGTEEHAPLIEAAAAAGIDAIVARVGPELPNEEEENRATETPSVDAPALVRTLAAAAKGLPIAVEIGRGLEASDVKALAAAGADAIAFLPERAAADIFDVSDLGRIARIGPDHPSSLLRGLNELAVDAIEIELDRPKGSLPRLTVHDLAELRQLVDAIRRPVLVVATSGVDLGDLKHLRELGTEALVVDVDRLGSSAEEVRAKVTAIREAIDKLGPPIGRGRANEGRRVFLPAVKPSEETEEAGEGDEDDDDD